MREPRPTHIQRPMPPAEQQLKAANKNLEYVLLSDIRGGKMRIKLPTNSGGEKKKKSSASRLIGWRNMDFNR